MDDMNDITRKNKKTRELFIQKDAACVSGFMQAV